MLVVGPYCVKTYQLLSPRAVLMLLITVAALSWKMKTIRCDNDCIIGQMVTLYYDSEGAKIANTSRILDLLGISGRATFLAAAYPKFLISISRTLDKARGDKCWVKC